jgi:hypothetical protein
LVGMLNFLALSNPATLALFEMTSTISDAQLRVGALE